MDDTSHNNPRSIQKLLSLNGKTALITGGGGHIGKAIAGAFAELGAKVAVLDINADASAQVCDDIAKTHGTQTMSLCLDIVDDDALRAVPNQVANSLGSLDILVNNAAFAGDKNLSGWAVPFEDQSVESWRAALEVNLTAAFSLCQSSAKFLSQSGNGSIINMGSIYGVVGPDNSLYEGTSMGNPAAYGASKGGIIQLTKYLSTVLAPKIRVNAISPGGLWRNQKAKFVERYEKRTPMKRMGNEEDLIGAATYFASDMSAYVTGQNLLVDGGWTAW